MPSGRGFAGVHGQFGGRILHGARLGIATADETQHGPAVAIKGRPRLLLLGFRAHAALELEQRPIAAEVSNSSKSQPWPKPTRRSFSRGRADSSTFASMSSGWATPLSPTVPARLSTTASGRQPAARAIASATPRFGSGITR